VLPYVASKFAVTGMTHSLASELAPHNITVNSIHAWSFPDAERHRRDGCFSSLRSGGEHHRRRLQRRRRVGNGLSGGHKRYAGAPAHEALLPAIWSCRPSGWSVQSAPARVVLRLPPRATPSWRARFDRPAGTGLVLPPGCGRSFLWIRRSTLNVPLIRVVELLSACRRPTTPSSQPHGGTSRSTAGCREGAPIISIGRG
jgi:hypothetical protein